MKTTIVTIAAASLLAFASCVKSLDINDNPNAPSSVDNNSQLAGSLLTSVRLQNGAVNELGSFWGGYWSKATDIAGTTSGAIGSALDVETNYSLVNSSANNIWDNQYLVIYNLQLLKAQAKADAPAYAGIADIVQGMHFMQIADYYNNIPFSDALDPDNPSPKYDNGLDAYKGAIGLITEGIDYLKNAGTAGNPGTSDIVFKGNLTSWIRLGNTLKLRGLLQLTNLSDAAGYISSEIAKIQSEGSGFLATDALANPGFAKNANQQNPFWDTYYQSYAGVTTTMYNAIRPSQFLVEMYQQYKDPRLAALYMPVNGDYVGVPLGSSAASLSSANTSAFRVGGVLKSATADALYFPAAESYFLQAEAIQRGLLSGDANAAYENGIKASMTYLGVAAADQEAYLAQPSVQLANATDKLTAIMLQKWLSLNSLDGTAAYNDYRRLGIPADLPGSIGYDASGKYHPYRLPYPTSEQNTNKTNVDAQGSIDPMNSKIFWMK